MTSETSPANILIAYYSTYGHIRKLAVTLKESIEKTGAKVTLAQIGETLPEEVLAKMHAPPKSDDPVVTPDDLTKADAILFGIPTRFGTMPAQVKTLLDSTGGLWSSGALRGKPVGTFFSTASQGGGQETTAFTTVTYFAHHGMIYVPMGYIDPVMFSNDEAAGGGPYGPGTLANGDGSRQPSERELKVTRAYGEYFANTATAIKIGNAATAK